MTKITKNEKMNCFEHCLAQGHEAEAYIAARLLDSGRFLIGPLSKEENQVFHSDFNISIARSSGVSFATIDVKADTWIAKTRNVAFEIWSDLRDGHCTPGWGQSVTTDYLIIVEDPSDGSYGAIRIFRLPDLQRFFNHHFKNLTPRQKTSKDSDQHTIWYPLPLKQLKAECGFWYSRDGKFDALEWRGGDNVTQWQFMQPSDCFYVPQPERITMYQMNDTPLPESFIPFDYSPMRNWQYAFGLQQRDWKAAPEDPANRLIYTTMRLSQLVDGYRAGGISVENQIRTAYTGPINIGTRET